MHGKRILGIAPAHQSAGSVRSRTIPLGIALSSANQRTVPHIDRNQQQLLCLCRNRPFPKNLVFYIDIVVNRREPPLFFQLAAFQNGIRNCPTVPFGKFLHDLYIVKILLQQFSLTVCQFIGNFPVFFQQSIRLVLIVLCHL